MVIGEKKDLQRKKKRKAGNMEKRQEKAETVDGNRAGE
jgi:hypothetical protein